MILQFSPRVPAPVLLLGLLLQAPLVSQPDWERARPVAKPVGLSDLAMAYDSTRDRVVLFGGWDGQKDLADTWEYDGTTWLKRSHRTSPGTHSTHRMAYDLARKNTVMFGGYCGSNCALGDTWTWDGTDWTKQRPAASPGARFAHAMAYDSARQRVVLFGGVGTASSSAFGDTWEWDGVTWTKITTAHAPSARYSSAMAYDAQRGRMVLFGGRGTARTSDTWTYDGRDWHRQAPTRNPGLRTAHAMVYDALRDRTVMFGGFDGVNHLDATWEWDGADWRVRTPLGQPSARGFTALAYDSKRQRTVMFGGGLNSTILKDNWVYVTKNRATYTEYGAGCAGAAGVPRLLVDRGALPWVGGTLQLRVTNLASTATVVVIGLGLSKTQWGALSLPHDLTTTGMPGCSILAAFDTSFVVRAQRGDAGLAMAIPNNSALVGAFFFNQAVAPGANNSLGLAVSNAGHGVLALR